MADLLMADLFQFDGILLIGSTKKTGFPNGAFCWLRFGVSEKSHQKKTF
jgi:hypothetical protein